MKLALSKHFLLLLPAMVACNQHAIPFESLQAESAKALCANYARCGLANGEQTCNAYFLDYLDSPVFTNSFYADRISNGRIKYDAIAAGQCLDSMKNAACGLNPLVTYYGEPQCQRVYRGTLTEGQSCSLTECAPGLYCAFSGTNLCGGTCQKTVGLGQTTSNSLACELGTELRDGKCQAPGKEGESCSVRCAGNLSCTAGKCVKLAQVGDACSSTSPCTFGLSCVTGKCALPSGLGESCGLENSRICKIELTCSVDSKCKLAATEGETCDFGGHCAPAFACVGASSSSAGTCKKRGVEGESCEVGTCSLELFCDLSTQKCKQKLPADSACDSANFDGPCRNGYCSQGKCVSTGVTCP